MGQGLTAVPSIGELVNQVYDVALWLWLLNLAEILQLEVVPDGPDVGALAAGTNLDETIFYCYRLAPSQVIVAGGESIRKGLAPPS